METQNTHSHLNSFIVREGFSVKSYHPTCDTQDMVTHSTQGHTVAHTVTRNETQHSDTQQTGRHTQ